MHSYTAVCTPHPQFRCSPGSSAFETPGKSFEGVRGDAAVHQVNLAYLVRPSFHQQGLKVDCKTGN